MDKPEPPISADVDVRDLDGFMLNVERLLASELVAIGTPEECWAALMLWCRAWKQVPGGSLPNDERILASFSGAGKRWAKVREVALHGFVLCSDGRLYHRFLCTEVQRAYQRKVAYQERRDADRKRLEKWRSKQRGNDDETRFVAEDTIRDRDDTEVREDADASSGEGACAPAPPKDRANGKSKPKTRLPADWEPDIADCRHAADRGWDGGRISDEAEGFRDYHAAERTLSGDWHASWRTWVKRSDEFAGRRNRGNGAAQHAPPRSGSFAAAARNVMSRLEMGGE